VLPGISLLAVVVWAGLPPWVFPDRATPMHDWARPDHAGAARRR
jgi:hypothetical protein